MDDERAFSLSDLSVAATTALIPLVAHARARTLFPEMGFADEQAERMVEALGVPLDLFGTNLGWLRATILRARWFDDRCREFFTANPGGLGVSLGAGLDTRFQRLNKDTIRWVDLDLPEVIALKRRFVKATRHYRLLACDITDPAWAEQIGWRAGMPLCLIAEGLLMYLAPSDVRTGLSAILRMFAQVCL
jgi:O-methyltransferase involved in polyketide biosynthesis